MAQVYIANRIVQPHTPVSPYLNHAEDFILYRLRRVILRNKHPSNFFEKIFLCDLRVEQLSTILGQRFQ